MLTGRYFVILVSIALWCLGCCAAVADIPATPAMTESQKKGAVFLDELSMPCPGEVFAALNKACHPNWATFNIQAVTPVTADRPQLALAVGVMAANGYVAVEAQDGQQVKNIGREMMSNAKALGVSQNLLGRGNSLIEFAKNDAWDSLADELEATENEVETTMVKQKDHALVTLTSAAAWLRALDVATGVILASDTSHGIDVISQPELSRRLAFQLETLPERMKKNPLVSEVKTTLNTVASLQESRPSSPKDEQQILRKIHGITSGLVKEILDSSTQPAAPSTPIPKPATPLTPLSASLSKS